MIDTVYKQTRRSVTLSGATGPDDLTPPDGQLKGRLVDGDMVEITVVAPVTELGKFMDGWVTLRIPRNLLHRWVEALDEQAGAAARD